jgi:hypothetical protein
MAKGKIKKFSTKDLKYKKIKLLTKCMLNKNINSNILEEDKAEFNSALKYRMFNHVLILPKILTYINTYLNNLYMFNKYSPNQWIKTFATILQSSDITTTSQLYFPKFKQSPRDAFFKNIRAYFGVVNDQRNLNNKELECIWQLYNKGIITSSEFNQMKTIGSGQQKTSAKSPAINISPLEKEQKIEEPTNKKVDELIEIVTDYIDNRAPCKKCSLNNNSKLIIDTNMKKMEGDVDLFIMSFSPTTEQISANSLSGDRLNKAFKDMLKDVCPEDFTYVHTNILMCKTPFSATVTKMRDNIDRCKDVVRRIEMPFNPKYKIILGTQAKSGYGITMALGKCHRQLIDGNHIVLNSPEEVANDKKKIKKFKESIEYIGNLLQENQSKEIMKKVVIPEEQMIDKSRLEKGWILFDTQVIDNEYLLQTFTHHETGEKKFHREDITFPVYIKRGNFKECDYITDQVDDVVYLTAREKAELSKQLIWNTRYVIKSV